MEQAVVLDAIQQVGRRVFGDPSIRLTESSTAADVDGWDSLSHVSFILGIEKHFRIKISVKEAVGLANVGELVDLVQRKAA
jgi:acyl carrier protein